MNLNVNLSDIEKASESYFKAESDWLDAACKKHLPENIYRWGKSGIPFAQRKACEFLAGEGYKLKRWQDKVQFVRGDLVLSEFKWSFLFEPK